MSPRAVRVTDPSRIERFDYANPGPHAPESVVRPPVRHRSVQVVPPGPVTVGHGPLGPQLVPEPQDPDPVEGHDERAIFAQGYAEGERAGMDLARRQLQALTDRVRQTLDQLSTLRDDLTRRTEREMVELALAIAGRILHREVSLDRELLLVMARLALDRLTDVSTATVRLHPDDEAAARAGRDAWPGGSVTIVADAAVRPGACILQTTAGQMELGIDAQLREMAAALLGEPPVVASHES
jgi:flagellar biosynthesis/type III secretory pathway protein FliH